MKKIISFALAALMLLVSSAALAQTSTVDIVGLFQGAEMGLSPGDVKEVMGAANTETEGQLVYDDPMNRATIQYNFENGALTSLNVVITYESDAVDMLYVHFLLYEARLMEYLGLAPSFQSYVDYADLEMAQNRFDGGMYGWYGIKGGDIYVGATFDSGTPLLYISSSALG